MKYIQQDSMSKDEFKNGGNGFKVIIVNVKDPGDRIYAVCSPIKMQ